MRLAGVWWVVVAQGLTAALLFLALRHRTFTMPITMNRKSVIILRVFRDTPRAKYIDPAIKA